MRNRAIAFLSSFVLSLALAGPVAADEAVATFAGGCFWCMEPPYDKLDGVKSTVSGFMGGHVKDPGYEQVVRGGTGHAEVVQVTYDPAVVSYETLLAVYWRNVDPFDGAGQFCDRGPTYRPAIFFASDEQERLARGFCRFEKGNASGDLAPGPKPFRGYVGGNGRRRANSRSLVGAPVSDPG